PPCRFPRISPRRQITEYLFMLEGLALKDYGMIVADNGGNWFLSGTPSSLWSDDDLHLLTQVPGSAFEAVDLRPVVSSINPASGSTGGGTAVTISGLNFSGGAGLTKVFFGTT